MSESLCSQIHKLKKHFVLKMFYYYHEQAGVVWQLLAPVMLPAQSQFNEQPNISIQCCLFNLERFWHKLSHAWTGMHMKKYLSRRKINQGIAWSFNINLVHMTIWLPILRAIQNIVAQYEPPYFSVNCFCLALYI